MKKWFALTGAMVVLVVFLGSCALSYTDQTLTGTVGGVDFTFVDGYHR